MAIQYNAAMSSSMDFGDLLRSKGHRVTNARQQVWEALSTSHRHLTAEQVAARAGPGVNLASVYRSLTLFTDIGLARESQLGTDGAARWELAHPDDQFHLICESCGGVEHHGGDLVDQIRGHLSGGHGFAASSVDLTVRGQCAGCAAA